MTRTAPVDPLSHSVGSRVKPLFVSTGAESVKLSADCGLSVTCRMLDCPAVDQSGCEHSRPQEAHFPSHYQ